MISEKVLSNLYGDLKEQQELNMAMYELDMLVTNRNLYNAMVIPDFCETQADRVKHARNYNSFKENVMRKGTNKKLKPWE